MNKPAVGVVGVGAFGQHHVKHLRHIEQCELVGIYDVDKDAAARAAELHSVRAFDSLETLCDNVQAACVAVPTSHHAEVATRLLDAGVDVLIEKPIASSAEEATWLLESAQRSGRKVAVGHIERFNPAFLAAANELDSLQFFRSERLVTWHSRNKDVDVTLDLLIHDIDLLLSIDPSEPEQIEAVGFSLLSPTFDIISARIQMSSGAVAQLEASRVSQSPRRIIRLHSGDEYYSIDMARRSARLTRPDSSNTDQLKDFALQFDPVDQLNEELKAFLQYCSGQPAPIADGHDGRRALQIAEEIIRSARGRD